YAEMVIAESMRLYPPAWVVGRLAIQDCVIGGYRVPKGMVVLVSQWTMHRHPRYFPEPEAFRPERWADGLAKRLPKYAYFPFGGGPRVCIGNGFAMMEAVLLLATLGRRWRFTVEPAPVTPWPTITLKPIPGVPAVLRAP